MDRDGVFEISAIELVVLRKLELVSKALADRLSGEASREQKCLADTLGDVLDRYQIAVGKGPLKARGE